MAHRQPIISLLTAKLELASGICLGRRPPRPGSGLWKTSNVKSVQREFHSRVAYNDCQMDWQWQDFPFEVLLRPMFLDRTFHEM